MESPEPDCYCCDYSTALRLGISAANGSNPVSRAEVLGARKNKGSFSNRLPPDHASESPRFEGVVLTPLVGLSTGRADSSCPRGMRCSIAGRGELRKKA